MHTLWATRQELIQHTQSQRLLHLPECPHATPLTHPQGTSSDTPPIPRALGSRPGSEVSGLEKQFNSVESQFPHL